jgi:carboxyl-terminal processing protease
MSLGGCAAPASLEYTAFPPRKFSIDEAERSFATGYVDIDKIYVERVSIGRLAVDGMNGLATLDPDATVVRDDAGLHARYRGRDLVTETIPADDDAEGWGAATANLMAAERTASPILKAFDPADLYDVVWRGALSNLDHYSSYADIDQARDNRAIRDGFGGVGTKLDPDNPRRIVSVMAQSPAAKAGVIANDEIIEINGQSVNLMQPTDIAPLLRGEEGTRIVLRLRHPGGRIYSVKLARVHLAETTVTYQRLPGGIGYFKITGFNGQTAETLRAAIMQARIDIGHMLSGFILDLRDNRGGLLDQGVKVADLFLKDGRILTTRGRHPESVQQFDATGDNVAGDTALVVLTNGKTASSAEIVAAALQDLGRAVIVGSTTYGKGTVQTILELPDRGELTLTWARLYAPSGYALYHVGVIPNVCTSNTGNDPAKPIENARLNIFDSYKIIQARRHADNLTQAEQDALIQQCPQYNGEHDLSDVDLDVAVSLFTDPTLMSHLRVPMTLTTVGR